MTCVVCDERGLEYKEQVTGLEERKKYSKMPLTSVTDFTLFLNRKFFSCIFTLIYNYFTVILISAAAAAPTFGYIHMPNYILFGFPFLKGP